MAKSSPQRGPGLFITPVSSVVNTGAKNSLGYSAVTFFSARDSCIQLLSIGLTDRLFTLDALKEKFNISGGCFHWLFLNHLWPASLYFYF